MTSDPVVATPKYRRWRAILRGVALLIFVTPLLGFLVADWFHLETLMPVRHRFFLKCLDLVTKKDETGFLAVSDPQIRDSVKKNLGPLGQSIRAAGPLLSCHLVNFEMTGHRSTFTYYLDYQKGSDVADFKIISAAGDYQVQSFNIEPVELTYRQAWEFDLGGKPFYLYIFLFLAFGLLFWNFSVLARCLFTPLKRKWLWFLFILLGFGSLSVTWLSDPSLEITPFTFHFPVVGISKTPLLEPWQVEMNLPVGMLVFLWLERRKKRGKG